VSAVNAIFIGSSNELGAFESGVTAKWFGPVGVGRRRWDRDDPGGAGGDGEVAAGHALGPLRSGRMASDVAEERPPDPLSPTA